LGFPDTAKVFTRAESGIRRANGCHRITELLGSAARSRLNKRVPDIDRSLDFGHCPKKTGHRNSARRTLNPHSPRRFLWPAFVLWGESTYFKPGLAGARFPHFLPGCHSYPLRPGCVSRCHTGSGMAKPNSPAGLWGQPQGYRLSSRLWYESSDISR
jgi:hypothetical protein